MKNCANYENISVREKKVDKKLPGVKSLVLKANKESCVKFIVYFAEKKSI